MLGKGRIHKDNNSEKKNKKKTIAPKREKKKTVKINKQWRIANPEINLQIFWILFSMVRISGKKQMNAFKYFSLFFLTCDKNNWHFMNDYWNFVRPRDNREEKYQRFGKAFHKIGRFSVYKTNNFEFPHYEQIIRKNIEILRYKKILFSVTADIIFPKATWYRVLEIVSPSFV